MKLPLLQRGRGHSRNQGRRGVVGKRTAAAVVAVTTTTSLTACDSDGSQNLLVDIGTGYVTLGMKSGQPGLGERTPDREFEDVNNDASRYVIKYIASKNGWDMLEMERRETPSAQRGTLINNDEVNVITATYSINADRLAAVDFAGPYLITYQTLLVRGSEGVWGLDDIAPGTRLCSISGSTPARKVKDVLPGVQLQEFDTYVICAEGIEQGAVDTLIVDAIILAGSVQRYKKRFSDDFRVVELRNPDGSYWTNEYCSIGLPKGDDASHKATNEALESLYDIGELQKTVKKHLGDKFELGDRPAIGSLSFVEKK